MWAETYLDLIFYWFLLLIDLRLCFDDSVREGSPDVHGPAPNIDIYDSVDAHANGAGVEGNTALERV